MTVVICEQPHSESSAQEHIDTEEDMECKDDQLNNDSKDNEEESMGIDIEQLDLDSRGLIVHRINLTESHSRYQDYF